MKKELCEKDTQQSVPGPVSSKCLQSLSTKNLVQTCPESTAGAIPQPSQSWNLELSQENMN